MWPLLLIGAGFYFYTQSQKTATPVLVPNANVAKQPQPAQQYPYQMPPVPRADFANQPWVGNIRAVVQGTSTSPGNIAVAGQQMNIGSAVGIASQATTLWNNLDIGSYFSSGNNSGPTGVASADTASYPPVDYSGDSSGASQLDGSTYAS